MILLYRQPESDGIAMLLDDSTGNNEDSHVFNNLWQSDHFEEGSISATTVPVTAAVTQPKLPDIPEAQSVQSSSSLRRRKSRALRASARESNPGFFGRMASLQKSMDGSHKTGGGGGGGGSGSGSSSSSSAHRARRDRRGNIIV